MAKKLWKRERDAHRHINRLHRASNVFQQAEQAVKAPVMEPTRGAYQNTVYRQRFRTNMIALDDTFQTLARAMATAGLGHTDALHTTYVDVDSGEMRSVTWERNKSISASVDPRGTPTPRPGVSVRTW